MVQAAGSQLSGVLLPADNVLNREILVANREEHVHRREMVAAAEGCCKKFVDESQHCRWHHPTEVGWQAW